MTRVLDAARFLEEAAFFPESFPAALAAVARTLGATELGLVNASGDIPAIIHSTNAIESYRQYFEGGWHEIDIRHQALLKAGPTQGAVVSEQSFVSEQSRGGSAFYQEYCKTFDLTHCVSWSYVLDGQAWGYSLLYGARAGPPEASDMSQLAQLAPHAIRAGILATKFHLTRAAGIAEGLSRASKPALVLDHRGMCVFVTAEAEQIFDNEFGLRSSRLWAADAQSNARLERLSEIAQQPFRTVRAGTASVHRRGQLRPLLLIPVPVSGAAMDAWPSARLVVMMVDLSRRPQVNRNTIQQVFSLTPAEARVAAALGEGCSSAEIAERFSLRLSTVRQQVKSVLSKAGVRRQSELVAILSRLSGGE